MTYPDNHIIPDGSIRRRLVEELRLMENHYRWERACRRRRLVARATRYLAVALGVTLVGALVFLAWPLA